MEFPFKMEIVLKAGQKKRAQWENGGESCPHRAPHALVICGEAHHLRLAELFAAI